MMNISKSLILCWGLIFSFSIQANVFWDSYRRDIKSMTVKGHKPLDDYSQTRRYLMQEVHLQKDNQGYYIEDVYCGIKFRKSVGPNQMPSDRFINVEHTWPKSHFNSEKNYKIQQADLHHLYPSDSRTNGIRGNHEFSEVDVTKPVSNTCPESFIGYDNDGHMAFEPPDAHKGNVARALFYFSIRYDISIPDYEEIFLREWNMMDPVDQAERERNEKIAGIQGNRNPFIDEPELADMIRNF